MRKHLPAILYTISGVILAACLFLVLHGCASGGGTPPPVPIPTTPPPTTTPPTITPLKTSGTQFTDSNGNRVHLIACHTCCTDESKTTEGWPAFSESAMLKCKAFGGTAMEIRSGPNAFVALPVDQQEAPVKLFNDDPTLYGFDGYLAIGKKYDLGKWNASYWASMQKLVSLAQQAGMYVGVDVVDRWVLRVHRSPWQNDRNVQGAEYEDPTIAQKTPRLWHASFIKHLADAYGPYPNVYFLTGNEGFLPTGACGKAFEEGIVDIIRAEEKSHGWIKHLVGSNCQIADIEKSPKIDFVVTHSKTAVAPRWNKPMYTNEQGDTNSAGAWLAQFQKSLSIGSNFTMWRGGMSDTQYNAALAGMKQALEAQ